MTAADRIARVHCAAERCCACLDELKELRAENERLAAREREMPLWIAGRWRGERWELLGCYSTEQAAVDRCRFGTDFVGPITLNLDYPDDTILWPGCYYPKETRP